MNVTEHQLSPATIEFIIELDRADIEQDLQRAAKRLSQHLAIAGFRKGQASYDMVCRAAGGEMKIYEEALQEIVHKSAAKQLNSSAHEVLGQPRLVIEKVVPPFGVSYKMTVSLMPLITLGDAGKISEKRQEIAVSDEDITKSMDRLREMRVAEFAVDRAAQTGDRVIVDIEVRQGTIPLEGGATKDYSLIIGSGQFIPGFEDQIIGVKQGDKKEFELGFPKQYGDKTVAGKRILFSVSVKQIFERMLPAADDEFAKGLGAASFEELKKQLAKSLEFERAREEDERFQMACMDALVAKSEIGELSDFAVREEVEKMLHELEHSVVERGGVFEAYLESIKKTKEDLAKEFEPKARQRLKLVLVARAFGKQEQVAVNEQEIADELKQMKQAHQQEPEAQARLEGRGYGEYIRNMLLSRKVFERLTDIVEKKTKGAPVL